MTREVDVNSGAAPQPGGWAGLDGSARGHALPGFDTEVEQVQPLNQLPDAPAASEEPEALDEQKAVADAVLEHQAVDLSEDTETKEEDSKDDEPEEKPAPKAAAKKTAKKSSK